MQLSLVTEAPELDKKFFLDLFAMAIYEPRLDKMKLETIKGHQIPCELKISCPHKFLRNHPEGTIFKLDARLVRRDGRKPYFIAINRKNILPAIEYFDYNLKVQNGFDYIPPTKR
ncbi:MAG: hypothetical protein NWQ46_07710 [Spirosomaceae bacterium]|nr:hypothetical protein [Spirosomataceae bacterium]